MNILKAAQEFIKEVLAVEPSTKGTKKWVKNLWLIMTVYIPIGFVLGMCMVAFGNEKWLPANFAERTEVWRADLHYHLPNVTPDSWENINLTPHGKRQDSK